MRQKCSVQNWSETILRKDVQLALDFDRRPCVLSHTELRIKRASHPRNAPEGYAEQARAMQTVADKGRVKGCGKGPYKGKQNPLVVHAPRGPPPAHLLAEAAAARTPPPPPAKTLPRAVRFVLALQ